MTAVRSIDPARSCPEHLAQASPDLLRELLSTFIQTLLSADADAVCGAAYGTVSPERIEPRNGYRHRDLDTRVGTIDVAIPKLRSGHATSRSGCWSGAAGRGGADHRWWRPATCSGSRPGGWTSWCSRWGSPGCPSRRSRRWPRISTPTSSDFRTRPLDAGPVHVRGRGRVDDEGPRGRPGGQRRRAGRDRRERRRPPRDPRHAGHHRRGRGRLAGVLPRPDRPRPVRGRSWSPPTRTPAWSRRSARPCPAPAGSGAAPTTRRT